MTDVTPRKFRQLATHPDVLEAGRAAYDAAIAAGKTETQADEASRAARKSKIIQLVEEGSV